jgi:endonuclease/exonuclease/phosphatase family metal-dependent hydrolase
MTHFIIKYFLAIFLLLFVTTHSFAQDTLKLLTWNVQMLPRFVKNNGKAKRAKIIVEKLQNTDYEVVILQEVFYRRARKIITQGLAKAYPYQTPVLNKQFIGLKTNGGVIILSKLPIEKIDEIRFKSRASVDRFARKGAVMATILWKNQPLQIVGTHLQAFSTADITYNQLAQIKNELLEKSQEPKQETTPTKVKEIPQIICGDFNIIKTLPTTMPSNLDSARIATLPRYPKLIEILQAEDGDLQGENQFSMDRPHNDLAKSFKQYRLLLDYVLLRKTTNTTLSIVRKIKIFRQAWHKEHQDLSDHFGVEALIIKHNE